MSFAMATFLVKHSARHSMQDHSQNKTRVCPICTLKFDCDAYNAHLKSVHQVDMALEEVKQLDERDESENLMCYLCQKTLEDQESLFIHKRDHLAQKQGSVASCSICDSSFVNAICLEAHMQTHYKLDWSFECKMCRSRFPENILLKSHTMSHGIPAPAISSVNRYRSQTQDGHRRQQLQNTTNNSTPIQIGSPNYSNSKICISTTKDEASSDSNVCKTGIPIQIPIQISTSQVTTTQIGTPLAIRTTDASGRNFIQLLPVQLVPIANSAEDITPVSQEMSNDSSIVSPDTTISALYPSKNLGDSLNLSDCSVKPKTKKKIPDLIPISKYKSSEFSDLDLKPCTDFNLRVLHSLQNNVILLADDHHNDNVHSIVSSSERPSPRVETQVKSEVTDASDVMIGNAEADSTTAATPEEDISNSGALRVRASGLLTTNSGETYMRCIYS